MSEYLTPSEFGESEGVADWRVLSDGAYAFFRTDSLGAAAALVASISEVAGIEEHQPDIDVRPDGVTVRFITAAADYMGMSRRDAELARAISGVARELGLPADPGSMQSLLIVPGAPSTPEVVPFWEAVLGYERRADSPEEDLVDPHGRGTAFWFEQMRETRPGGLGAIHVAVWVPAEVAEKRVAAALAAGGRMVRDGHAPTWWTLADAAGNEVDVATIIGRD